MLDAMQALLPPFPAEEQAYLSAFRRIADLLLNRTTLLIAQVPHRLTEVEFYFHGGYHLDPFAHRQPIQKTFGQWYFHRSGNTYRSGTYKGLDITFGHDHAFGGILLRGVMTLDKSRQVDGPSLVVDHILTLTSRKTIVDLVSQLDLRINTDSALCLVLTTGEGRNQPIYESSRIGLTLKKDQSLQRQRYLTLPYRFLTEPSRIKKGKVNLILSLIQQGKGVDQISTLTGAHHALIDRYEKLYQEGRQQGLVGPVSDGSTEGLCRLLGACAAVLEKKP